MTIIGIDPGSVSCGFGIINISNNDFSIVNFGLVKPKAKSKNFIDRLKYLYDTISNVIIKNNIDEAAVETQFYHNNAQSLMKLTQARTSVELAAINLNIPIFEYSPREIKLSVTGKGNATKKSVNFMVSSILKINLDNVSSDVSDALAVALCHGFKKSQSREEIKNSPRNWEEFIASNPERIINY